MNRLRPRAFTLIELLVVMAIIGLLIGILMPAVARARGSGRALKDSTQIRAIHQCWLIFAREFEGVLPTPGLIDRQPVDGTQEIPGRGNEDQLMNDTARLHSAMIMQQFYTADLCVGPTEPSSRVSVKDDYNHELYDVTADVYWDDSFVARLNLLSNISYASMPIAGQRQTKQWRETLDSAWPILGTRGVRHGLIDAQNYNRSMTLLIHGGRKEWVGNVCFNDNRVEMIRTFIPEGVNCVIDGVTQPDNIFRNDTSVSQTSATGYDAWLVIIDKGQMIGSSDTVNQFLTQWD